MNWKPRRRAFGRQRDADSAVKQWKARWEEINSARKNERLEILAHTSEAKQASWFFNAIIFVLVMVALTKFFLWLRS